MSSKRKYDSGAFKRAEKKRKIEEAKSNTRKIATFFSKQELNDQTKDDSEPTTSAIEPITTKVSLEEQQQPVDLASDVEGKSECVITKNITLVDPLNSESASRKEKPEFDFDISPK